MKALAGKHITLDKPCCSRRAEAALGDMGDMDGIAGVSGLARVSPRGRGLRARMEEALGKGSPVAAVSGSDLVRLYKASGLGGEARLSAEGKDSQTLRLLIALAGAIAYVVFALIFGAIRLSDMKGAMRR